MNRQAASAFGPFQFDPVRMSLLRDSDEIALGARGASLLAALLAAKGNVVSKNELLEAVWPDAIVEENNLAVQIASLRKALGQQQSGQDWIVTVPRLGYRLLLPAEPNDGTTRTRRPALVVLPFQNLGAGPEQDYLADGIVADITATLSRFKSFSVVARSSAYAYRGRAVDVRQLGQELGVRYVLEGTVRAAQDRLRVTAQLVETEGGTQLWGGHFDGSATALFETQDEIAANVIRAIQPNIRRAEVERARLKRTTNLTAYDLYLRALPHLFYREGAAVTDTLEAALKLDPNFTMAAAVAATQYITAYFHQAPGSSEGNLNRGRVLLAQVLPACSEDPAIASLCSASLMQLGEYDRAIELADAAIARNPNDAEILAHAGVVHLFAGDLDTANRLQLQALNLSPNEYSAHGGITCVSHIRMVQGLFEEALEWAKRSLSSSVQYGPTYWMLIAGSAHLGRLNDARQFVAELQQIVPGVSISGIRKGLHARDMRRVEILFSGMLAAGLPMRVPHTS